MNLILVLSKDPEITKAITESMDSGWSRVWTCNGPKDALSTIGQQEPAVIVIDGRHDPHNSVDFLKKLKIELKMDYLSILMFVTNSGQSQLKQLTDLGVDETLAWPSPIPVISHKIRLLIDKYDSRKIRKNHHIDLTQKDVNDFLKSDSQYGDQSAQDPFFINRKSLFVPRLDPAPKASTQTKPIDLPEDYFSTEDGLDLESSPFETHHQNAPTDFDLNTVGRKQPLLDSVLSEKLEEAIKSLTPEHIDQMAEKILEKKLSEAAKENIRKLIADSIRQELKKLMPEIVSLVKKQMAD